MKNKFNDKKCAPGVKYEDGSCFSHNSLLEIAKEYNIKFPNKEKINVKLSKPELVEKINIIFKDNCTDQVCWKNQKLVKLINNEEIHNGTFVPEGPEGKYEWLSTTDINDVLEQYQNVHKDFLFLGAVPYDFEDLPSLGIATLNFKQLMLEGKTKIGLVINLDEHYKSGSHWVALYTDLLKNQIYYFDSVAKGPKKRIKKFVNKITKFLYEKNFKRKINITSIKKKLKIISKKKNKSYLINNDIDLKNLLNSNFDIKFNNIQHQFKNSECGVYSINFIIRLVNGESFNNIIKNITDDETMNKYRQAIFSRKIENT